ncbi:hypothetical protein [Conchiformibius kuhniae]|uniref:Uncharacterized protein n=1 Tax=Conchiformibius kuhniae TaxID=211502 RepID=A0ABD8B858_9NEIS|nr:hypothetical protein [Conchiformibius kuhniae]
MKHNGQSEPSPTLRTAASVTAARYSLLLMLASLCLPALSLDRNMMFGLGIWVFMGFGWMFPVIGWAVYANLFYWAALLMFRLGGTRSVKALLWITWILAVPGTVFFAMREQTTFGWGAVLWFLSFGALTFAVYGYDVTAQQMRRRLTTMTAVAVLPILPVYAWQWQHANELERRVYLRLGAAFTLKPLSGQPYVPPPALPPQSTLALHGDWDGSIKPWTVVELPGRFDYRGWRVQIFKLEEVALLSRLPENSVADYQYGLRNGEWFLADKQGKTLWRVPHQPRSLLNDEYDRHWDKQFAEHWPPEPSALPVGEETAFADCPPAPSAAPFAHAVDWLGQTVLPLKDWERRPAADYRGYCSPNYAVLVARDSEGDYPGHAIVFSREPFRPLNRHSSWAGDTKTWPDSIILTTPPPGDTGWVRMPEIRSHFQSSGQ